MGKLTPLLVGKCKEMLQWSHNKECEDSQPHHFIPCFILVLERNLENLERMEKKDNWVCLSYYVWSSKQGISLHYTVN